MSTLMRMCPGDGFAVLAANVFVQATLVISLAWCLTRFGSRWNAAWRHSVYLSALVFVLASPGVVWIVRASGISFITLQRSVPHVSSVYAVRPPTSFKTESNRATSSVSEKASAPEGGFVAIEPKLGAMQADESTRSSVDVVRMLGAIAWLTWLVGVIWLLARWTYGLYFISVLRRKAQPLCCDAFAGLLSQVRQALEAEHLPTIAVSASVDRPVMVGLIRPLVLMPESVLSTVQESQLVDILVHECAHAVRRHQVENVLQRAATMLFWPHPLVHQLNRWLARAREEVCDNYVICRGHATRYALTLLELSQSLVTMSPTAFTIGLFHCRWRLEDRIVDMLNPRRKTMTRVKPWKVGIVAAALLTSAVLIAGTRVLVADLPSQEKDAERTGVPEDKRAPTSQTEPVAGTIAREQDGELRRSAKNLQVIMSALHTYHDAAGHFPTARTGWGFDRQSQEWFRDRPYLSWRVLLLPYLGEIELFKKFHLDQPWDSDDNRKLIPLMPQVYKAPGSNSKVGMTNYLGSIGPNSGIPDKGAITIPEFTDGTSYTIMLVEVPDQASVEWTRPEDFMSGGDADATRLVGLRRGGFLTVFADAAPHFISDKIPPATLQQLLIRNDARPIAPDDWQTRWDTFVQPADDDK